MMRYACVILAGGAATRMGGGDKPLLLAGGRTLLGRLLDRLAGAGVPMAINTRGDAARFAAFGLPVLPDDTADGVPDGGAGPLAGVLAAMDWAAGLGCDAVLTVPGDTPFVPRDLLAALASAPAVALSGGRRHHLVALWPVAARAALRARLAATPAGAPRAAFGVRAFAETIGMREVTFPDQPFDPFFNVNTPEDLAAARRIAATQDAPRA
ncbi:molybdopterin-guanine dinucleotide biosynthesis protein A [Gluconacetobacter diazotrophicus PA1 5]|uniref:NTP transferase domain-containing protein n=1 Tax=Gluconacetobacter diazotrophicus TaxID=33996 RepID=UPI000173C243|nr:NTP transferase domain-containing protein [Gluconacetobacter diazotrophicus]ACI51992.1 molybdopterin-guanine dinucleotide biosynthesis protein A [Gluconacetobacter diazotrophicus PA1 5]TWB05185.1 molybdopterin-guanine dinucleotide biosynthesis protein A [Gluconacetobacter diazotrophicus]